MGARPPDLRRPLVRSKSRAHQGASRERIPALERVPTGSSSRDPLPLASSPPTTNAILEIGSSGRPSPARAIAAAPVRVDHARVSAALQRRSLRARAPELARVCRRVLVVLLFGILPASLLLAILVGSFRSGTGAWAIDFDGNFLRPAHEILRGVSPYHPGELEHVRRAVAAGHRPDEFHDGVFPAYPAPALLLGVPFSYLPLGLAEWIWAACMLLAGGLALRLVGVRDWRVYGVALLTPAAMSSVLLGAVDFALMLGIAACWRWRDHAGRAGLALGAIVALKLVAAPLVAWLLVTRRWRAAATAGAVAAGAVARGLGSDRIPRLLGLSAPALAADRHRERSRLLGRGLRESDRHLRPGRVACALRPRHRPAGGALAREQASAGGGRGGLPRGRAPPASPSHRSSGTTTSCCCSCRSGSTARASRRSGSCRPLCWVVWRGAFLYTGPAERLVFLVVIAGICAWMLTRTRAADVPEGAPSAPRGTLPAWR